MRVSIDQRRKDQRLFQDQHWPGGLAWKDFAEGSPGKRVAITGKGKEEVPKKTEQEGRGEKKKPVEFTIDMHDPGQEASGSQESRRKERDQHQGDRICERQDEEYNGEPSRVRGHCKGG